MKRLLLFVHLLAASLCYAQNFQLNEREYFERQGVNVLVFSNSFNGGFNDEKNSGVEIIHHGVLQYREELFASTILPNNGIWYRR